MTNISIGKLRGLQQLSDSKGMMTMCAIDHRGALKRALNEKNAGAVSYQESLDCTPMIGQIGLGESGRVSRCSPD